MLCIIIVKGQMPMGSTKVRKQSHRKRVKKGKVEEDLNIRYHDVNPQWNYTISPRPTKSTKQDER